jgi:hypothetical protein
MKLVNIETDALQQMSKGLNELGNSIETITSFIGNNAPIDVTPDGKVCIKDNLQINGKLGIGVNNIPEDVDLMIDGPISFNNIKMQSAEAVPEVGTYNQGDIVWNNKSQPGGYVGWVCIRTGTPGLWKSFGLIEGQ